jgi:hypothetical protein
MTNAGSLARWLFAVLLLSGCAPPRSEPAGGPRPQLEQTPQAMALIARHAKRFRAAPQGPAKRLLGRVRAPAPAPLIDVNSRARFVSTGNGFRPELPPRSTRGQQLATTLLPARADGRFQLTDDHSGASVGVRLLGARPVAAQAAGGYLVYPGGHANGADLLHRAVGSGAEDLVVFEKAPAEEAVRYEISLGDTIAGLRLIAGNLELLDAKGAPRLRVRRPYLVEAKGRRVDADLALEGCAADVSPKAPWGRPVVPPGARTCTVRVSWGGKKVTYPAALDPTWSTTGDMTVPRMRHLAAVLTNGRVLIAGGNDAGISDLYDPNSGTFAATGPVNVPRGAEHVMTRLQSGLVLMCGGQNFFGQDQTVCELYDPNAGTWSIGAPMISSRTGATMTLLASGKVLVAGGMGFAPSHPNTQLVMDTAEVYDPAGAGSWTPTANPMSLIRIEHNATRLPSGKVMITGGSDGTPTNNCGACNHALWRAVDIYDPNTNSFTLGPPISPTREGHTTTLMPNGKVLLAGGFNRETAAIINEVQIYDPNNGPIGAWSAGPPMPLTRWDAREIVLNDGNVLIFGGSETGFANPTTMVYYPALNYWSRGADLNVGHIWTAAAKLNDGRALITGGENADGLTAAATAELYNFKSDGAACNNPNECTTGNCVAGICCDSPCNAPNTTQSCATGRCTTSGCTAPFANCDGSGANGCETNLDTTATSCGGCGAACSVDHVNPACVAGSCQAGTCVAGFGDCNNDKRIDGCETNLNTSAANCGGCGAACSVNHVTAACAAGSCQGGTCDPGWVDCNSDKRTDGCETIVTSGDPSSCGGCGQACNTTTGTPSCTGSTCTYVCNTGRKDCATTPPNLDGCETNSTVNGNCGGCGVTCPSSACATGVCNVVGGEGVCGSINVSACATPFCLLPNTGCTATWKDTDGDGLSDAWETPVTGQNGGVPFVDLNCNGRWDGASTDIALPGATPGTKDIFIYYNYRSAHNHRPPQAALDQVVAAFAAHQVNVHFVDGGPIAETVVTTLDPSPTSACAGTSVSTMQALRTANFGNRKPAFHYMVFAHRANTPDATHASACPRDPLCNALPKFDSTGSADLPGDDIIISFGAKMDDNGGVPPEPFLYATTIMHELGHNLGLKHGGADACVIDKPNYVSIMNPENYQLNGIPVADNFGSNNFRICNVEADCGPPAIGTPHPCATPNACHCTTGLDVVLGFNYCYRVDYAVNPMISLNEAGLGCDGSNNNCTGGGMNESVGVGGPANSEDVVLFWVPGPSQRQGSSTGPIDWDDSGVPDGAHIMRDINNDSSFTNLTTQLDWPLLNFQFQCSGGYGPGGSGNRITHELSPTAAAGKNAAYPPRKVKIDVRPGCPTNWLIVGAPLKVPVALFGEATLDVATIDTASIRLAGARPASVSTSDLNGDGRKDLLLAFTMSSLAITPTQTKVSLVGARTIGQTIYSSDSITIVPSPGPTIALHNDGSGFSRTLDNPANHQLATFSLADCVDKAADRCGKPLNANAAGKILRITSDEAGAGGGPPGSDMAINSASSFSVRKERNGNGDGRVYTVTFTEADADGNTTQAQCKIQVPHHPGGPAAVDSGVAACIGSGC